MPWVERPAPTWRQLGQHVVLSLPEAGEATRSARSADPTRFRADPTRYTTNPASSQPESAVGPLICGTAFARIGWVVG